MSTKKKFTPKESALSVSTTSENVKRAIDGWIDYYNNDRFQWELAKLFPDE